VADPAMLQAPEGSHGHGNGHGAGHSASHGHILPWRDEDAALGGPRGQAMVDYVAFVCDQDAYACAGQKCSAQSMLVIHESWRPHLEPRMRALAARRKLSDLTAGPTLSVTTAAGLGHVSKLLKLPGARLLWGGKELEGGRHGIPQCYGAMEPTAVEVPLETILASNENFDLATTEIFAPFQVVTYFSDKDIEHVCRMFDRMHDHLTAAVVSSDPAFQQRILARSVNGTTYVGVRARTTGAPQNHWFGPAGDPRAAGIGTPEAIQGNYSCHREIVRDVWPVPDDWTLPAAS